MEQGNHHRGQNGGGEVDRQPDKSIARGLQRGAVNVGFFAQAHQPHQIVLGLFVDHVNNVIERHHPDQPTRFFIGNWRGGKTVLAECVGQLFLVQHRRKYAEIALGNVGQRFLSPRAQDVADRR